MATIALGEWDIVRGMGMEISATALITAIIIVLTITIQADTIPTVADL